MAVVVCLCVVGPAGAAQIMLVEFQQLDFWPEDGPPLEMSSVGRCVVEYQADPQAEFLNVAARAPAHGTEPVWVVRNMWLHDDGVGEPFERLSMRFPLDDLGLTAGEPLGQVQFELHVTPEPLTDDEADIWLSTVTLPLDLWSTPKPVKVNDGFTEPPTLPEPAVGSAGFWPDFLWPPFLEYFAWIGCAMPNMELDSSAHANDRNACVPAACANSLRWLADLDADDNIEINDTDRELLNQLSHLMERAGPHGVEDKELIRAKLDIVEALDLPIDVKYRSKEEGGEHRSTTGNSAAGDPQQPAGWPDPDWILSEAADGEDVEVGVGFYTGTPPDNWTRRGGHCVVLSGGAKVCGVPYFAFKHDSEQGTDEGEHDQDHELSYGQIIGGRLWIPGLDTEVVVNGDTLQARAHVETVVSESPSASGEPPEGYAPMDSFCVERRFMVPAGGGIEFEFPNVAKRKLNVRLDINEGVGPTATRRIKREWTNNRGKTRGWVNDTGVPVMVAIHNDDDTRDKKGNPIPWGVGVDIRQRGESCSDTPANPEQSGGTSTGARDGSSDEYNPTDMGPVVQAGPIGEGFSYQDIPAQLSDAKGTRELEVWTPIPAWHEDWERLRFHLDVAELYAPGQLEVQVLASGEIFLLDIVAPGRYSRELMDIPPSPDFFLRMTAMGGLDMELDAFGCAPRLDVTTAVPEGDPPERLVLSAWPNPFNPSVTLSFGLPAAGPAELAVFDLRGRRVRTLLDAEVDAGQLDLIWDGRDEAGRALPAGSYHCRLRAAGEMVRTRVTLLK